MSKSVVVLNKIKSSIEGFVKTNISNLKRTQFDEVQVASKTRGFSVSPIEGPSKVRNISILENNGTITANNTGEIKVSSGTTINGYARMETNQRGVYYPGAEAEAGLGIRLNRIPEGTEAARYGYFDSENGFGFGIDSESLFVFIRRGGEDNIIRRENWNTDKLDGGNVDE